VYALLQCSCFSVIVGPHEADCCVSAASGSLSPMHLAALQDGVGLITSPTAPTPPGGGTGLGSAISKLNISSPHCRAPGVGPGASLVEVSLVYQVAAVCRR
jgi:hypothetical protein